MADCDHITRLDWIAWLKRLDAIDTHLAVCGEFDGEAAVLDDARMPQPAVDPQRVFGSWDGLRDRASPSFDLMSSKDLAL